LFQEKYNHDTSEWRLYTTYTPCLVYISYISQNSLSWHCTCTPMKIEQFKTWKRCTPNSFLQHDILILWILFGDFKTCVHLPLWYLWYLQTILICSIYSHQLNYFISILLTSAYQPKATRIPPRCVGTIRTFNKKVVEVEAKIDTLVHI
jgi:hypothetical protein